MTRTTRTTRTTDDGGGGDSGDNHRHHPQHDCDDEDHTTTTSAQLGEEVLPSKLGRYRVLRRATIREAFERTSKESGILEVGEVITVVEGRTNDNTQERLRFDRGWASVVASNGALLLEYIGSAAPGELARAVAASAASPKQPEPPPVETGAPTPPIALVEPPRPEPAPAQLAGIQTRHSPRDIDNRPSWASRAEVPAGHAPPAVPQPVQAAGSPMVSPGAHGHGDAGSLQSPGTSQTPLAEPQAAATDALGALGGVDLAALERGRPRTPRSARAPSPAMMAGDARGGLRLLEWIPSQKALVTARNPREGRASRTHC